MKKNTVFSLHTNLLNLESYDMTKFSTFLLSVIIYKGVLGPHLKRKFRKKYKIKVVIKCGKCPADTSTDNPAVDHFQPFPPPQEQRFPPSMPGSFCGKDAFSCIFFLKF